MTGRIIRFDPERERGTIVTDNQDSFWFWARHIIKGDIHDIRMGAEVLFDPANHNGQAWNIAILEEEEDAHPYRGSGRPR